MIGKAKSIQRRYYNEIASAYDTMHISADDQHYVALKYISRLLSLWGISSILDVGCGTGRAVQYFAERGVLVRGVEPVLSLIDQAIKKEDILPRLLVCGTGESLPFRDGSFDAVCEFGVLHHVQDPQAVVKEMMRVARKAVILSDSNRFGQGSMFSRLIKLLLYRIHLWGVANLIKTRGKGYTVSKGDGLAYSYSVFDSYDLLANWADRLILIPTGSEKATTWYHPLLTSGHVLLCGIVEGTTSDSRPP